MFRKALIAATAAGALALGIGAFATPADAYVRFGVYVGPGYYGGYCGPYWHRYPCYGAYYSGGPYFHHHYYYPYYHHYYYYNHY